MHSSTSSLRSGWIWLIVCVAFITTGAFFYLKSEAPSQETVITSSENESPDMVVNADFFALHPDSQTLAYVARENDSMHLYIQPAGQQPRLLVDLGSVWKQVYLNWSPDGRKLIYIWRGLTAELVLLEFEPENEFSLVKRSVLSNSTSYDYSNVEWLDNDHLILSRSLLSEDRNHLYVMPLKTLEFALFSPPDMVGDALFTRLTSSQNGYVAFVQNKDKQRNFRVFDPRGQEILTYASNLIVNDIALLPQQDGVLFFSNKGAKVIHLDGLITDVTLGKAGIPSNPQFSHDGNYLYWSHYTPSTNIVRRELKPELLPLETVSQSPSFDGQARCRFSSTDFSLVSERSGLPQIWLQQGTQSTQLTHFKERGIISHLHWSHDGQMLVFKRDNSIFIYSLKDEQLTPVIQEATQFIPLGFNRQADSIYYGNLFTNNIRFMDFWQKNLTSGGAHQLDIPPSTQAIVSKGELYFLHPETHSLNRWDPSGAIAMKTHFQRDSFLLAENEQFIYYYLPRPNQRRRIWLYDKQIQQHQIVIQRDQYSGDITDVCDDNNALLSYDSIPLRQVYRIASSNLLIKGS